MLLNKFNYMLFGRRLGQYPFLHVVIYRYNTVFNYTVDFVKYYLMTNLMTFLRLCGREKVKHKSNHLLG